jgi:hypothetical protein
MLLVNGTVAVAVEAVVTVKIANLANYQKDNLE